MLNMDQYIHPLHWSVEQFEVFPKLSPEREFDLIAPVAIYFCADVCHKEQAKKAWQKLKKLDHPIAQELSTTEMVKENHAPDGVCERYNALFMHLCKKVWVDAVFDQDRHGAFNVANGKAQECDDLSGDGQGEFPWFTDYKTLKNRLTLAQE